MPTQSRQLIEIMLSPNPVAALDMLNGVAEFSRQYANWRFAAWTSGIMGNTLRSRLRKSHSAGALLYLQDKWEIALARRWGRPFVNLMEHLIRPALPCVAIDDHAVGRMGAEHLIACGCPRLAFVSAPHRFAHEREAGFCTYAGGLGREVSLLRVGAGARARLPQWTELNEGPLISRWLAALPKPVGIMACNDGAARRVVDECEALGLKVPDEVAVLGVDNNVTVCEFSPFSMSSVDVDYARLGYRAAEMLHEMLQGGLPPQKPLMLKPKGIVVRRSTDVLAFADPDVRRAMRLMRERAGSGLTVEAVAEELSISRRSLERKLRDALGRTPGEEIRRIRMHRAMRMIVETDLKIREIATATGFDYLSHFTNAFHKTFGISPTRYRTEDRYRRGIGQHPARAPGISES